MLRKTNVSNGGKEALTGFYCPDYSARKDSEKGLIALASTIDLLLKVDSQP